MLGGGIAGLTAAIAAARRWRVGLLTKASLNDTTTFLAQGGIAAALGESDSPELHFQDTVDAGAGLCDPDAVRVLVNEGPDRVRELIEICPRFDRQDGEIVLGREGAHSVRRVLHAGGDATGREVSSTLSEAARVGSRVQLYEDEFVIDLLTIDGRCIGALSLNLADGEYTLNLAMVTILATGGAGQVYARTTNPEVATGDGVAMAYRAGASIRDLEFVQFHPTGLAAGGSPTPLITEALRGEGAVLRNAAGERFMVDGRPQGRARGARRRRARHARRDARRGLVARLPRRDRRSTPTCCASAFPRVTALLAEHDLDLSRDLIPVAPVAHYFIGGVGHRRLGPHHRARPLRRRRGRQHRRARRQSPRLELAARGPRLRRSRRAPPRPLHRRARRRRAPPAVRAAGALGADVAAQRHRRRAPGGDRAHVREGRLAAHRGRPASRPSSGCAPPIRRCVSARPDRPSSSC